MASAPSPAPAPITSTLLGQESYSPATQYSSNFCQDGQYPTAWNWNPASIVTQAAPATSGTPKIVQVRNGVAIATYTALGGDPATRSKPNSENGTDTSVGPFRRAPYLQWKSGDTFLVYPAVYSGKDMQLYIGPNFANDADFKAGKYVVPSNITIRGVTVDGKRPVIVNPPTGASNSTYGQGLIYIDGAYDADKKVIAWASNITIENLDIVDSPTGGRLGKAAIYVNAAKDLTLRNVRIAGFKQHSANGIFSTGNTAGSIVFENVELDSNGGGGGPEHNAYINGSTTDPTFTFRVTGSWSHDSYYGHELKSRAQRTIIEGSYLTGHRAATGELGESYLLDVPDGGELTVRNTIFVKNFSGNGSNGASLTFGVESALATRSWGLTVEHNTFVALSRYYDDAKHKPYPLYISAKALGDKKIDSNVYVGYCTGDVTRDAPGTNAVTLNFNDIDLSYRPRLPRLTGDLSIIGTKSYWHTAQSSTRKTNAVGARD